MASPPPSNDESVKVAKRANRIAIAAALVAVASGIIGYLQYRQAERANDMLQAAQAQSVYFDAAVYDAAGLSHVYLYNRNKAPITSVSYRYAKSGVEEPTTIAVGALPGCAMIELTNPSGQTGPDFAPTLLKFTDPNGVGWQRSRDGGLTLAENGEAARRDGGPQAMPISNC